MVCGWPWHAWPRMRRCACWCCAAPATARSWRGRTLPGWPASTNRRRGALLPIWVMSAMAGVNFLSTPVIDGLRVALARLAKDASVRVLVLRGASDRAFVAGADIAEMAGLDEQKARRFIANLRDLCDAVRHFPAPVIARIPGWC